jgi:hypothetical protein
MDARTVFTDPAQLKVLKVLRAREPGTTMADGRVPRLPGGSPT